MHRQCPDLLAHQANLASLLWLNLELLRLALVWVLQQPALGWDQGHRLQWGLMTAGPCICH